MGWIDDDTFEFFVPAQIIKAQTKPRKRGEKPDKRWIQGVASTTAKDLQGEIVDQQGIDFSYFLSEGYFNNDHQPGFANKVGQPTEARITKNGLWVKGFLFENHKISDEIWELMHSLEATQADRRLGFSIQGKVKRRQGSTIKECWIQDIAITPAPINTTTWAEIAKSLSAQNWELENKSHSMLTQNVPEHGAHSVLAKESLDEDKKKTEEEDQSLVKKSLTKVEAVNFLKTNHGLPLAAAENVANAIFLLIPGENT